MFPQSILKVLVFGLAVIIVAFAVVMGGYALLQGPLSGGAATGNDPIAASLYGVGIGLFVLLMINAVLLLVALGANELSRRE